MLYRLLIVVACFYIRNASSICSEPGNVSCASDANATFTEDRILITVDFNNAVKPPFPYSGCEAIFTGPTLNKLGSNPICSFISEHTLKIYPDISGTLTDGDVLDFKASSTLYKNGTTVNIGLVAIQPGLNTAFIPDTVIYEDGYSSDCSKDKYYVSADFSRNSGYGHFSRYDWALDGVISNVSGMVSSANSYLEGQTANASEIEITSVVLASNRSVSVNITNIFGQTRGILMTLMKRSTPVARVNGGNSVEIFENIGYHFTAELFLSKCEPGLKEANYSWSMRKADGNQTIKAEDFNTVDMFMHVKPFSLSAETIYNITVQITYRLSDNSVGVVSDSVSATVKKVALAAVIDGGDRQMGQNQTLVLQGREATGRGRGLTMQWGCNDLSTGDICKNKSGSPIVFGNSSVMLLSLADGNFVAGKRYQFKLTISRSSEMVSTSIQVTIKPFPGAVVSVTMMCPSCSHNQDIFFLGVLLADSSVNYNWQIMEPNGNPVALQSSNGSLSNDHGGKLVPYSIVLKVPKNTLHPGYAYTVKLTADAQASSSLAFELGLPPRHGNFKAEPKEGVAFNTTFRLRSYAWIDRKMHKPLHYRFGYMEGSNRRFLTVWQRFNVLSGTFLPSGNSSDENSLTLFVQIKNAIGLVAEKQAVVKVSSQQLLNQEHLLQYYKEMLGKKDYESMSVGIVGLMKTGLNDSAKQVHLDSYLKAVNEVPFLPSLSSIFINTLSDVVKLANKSVNILTLNVKEKVASLVFKITKLFEQKESRTNYQSPELTSALGIFVNLLPEPGMTSSSDANIVQLFKNTTRLVTRLLCHSFLHSSSLNVVKNALIGITSGTSDLTKDIGPDAAMSLSPSFRRKFIQDSCSGVKYLGCIGMCWSFITYKDSKFFNINQSQLVTNVHEGKLVDLHNKNERDSAAANDFKFDIPVSRSYDKNTSYIKCIMQDPLTLSWSDSFCHSTLRNSGASQILSCACSKLFPVAGIKVLSSPPTTSPPSTNQSTSAVNLTNANSTQPPISSTASVPRQNQATTPLPNDVITIVLKVNCTKYVLDAATRAQFIESLVLSLEVQLKIAKSRIKVWSLECGSILANISILDPAPSQSSEPSKSAAMLSLQNLLGSGLMRVSLYDGSQLGAVAPGVNIKTLPPPTTILTTRPTVPAMTTNWMPMMVSFALVLALIIGIALFIAWLHGRYYRKKHFTDINSNRMKPKKEEEEDRVENMNSKQKAQKFDKIMDDSIENAEIPTIIVAAPVALKRTKGKSRISPLNGNFPSSAASSRSNISASFGPREMQRLALDDSSSGSEAETSFTERPKSTVSQKSRTKNALSVKSRGRSAKSRNNLSAGSSNGDETQSQNFGSSRASSTHDLYP